MLHLFPTALESNLLVPVLLGVLVTLAFNETLGWDFVGVVVPGYLCAVAIVQPTVAVVVVCEAVVTCLAARAIDRAATRWGLWYPVFGRDRFYFILAVSVLVRVALEAAVPALLARWWTAGAQAWSHADLFGVGLVLVPLAANRLWRAGVAGGLLQLGVEVGVVRALLAGLVLLTNFSLSGFELSFDRLALAFLTSPLSQLALVLTAAIASDFNRRYGWDSHGILVPALLALVVLSPVKLLATFVEAAVVAGTVLLLVRLPRLRHANLDGARKVSLCFVVGFAAKWSVATVVEARAPSFRATELFGFGYLLPSLLAERVIVRASLPLVLIPTLQTAIVGMPLAGALGLLMGAVSPHDAAAGESPAGRQVVAAAGAVTPLAGAPAPIESRRPVRVALFEAERPQSFAIPPARETLDAVARLIEAERAEVQRLAAAVAPYGLAVGATPDGYATLTADAWPRVAVRVAAERRAMGPVVVAPHARESGAGPAALEAALTFGTDCVVASEVGDADGASVATELAAALARAAHTPLLVVRGTDFADRHDFAVLSEPSPARAWPAWFEPLGGILGARFSAARLAISELASLRAFPSGAGRDLPTVLLWLGSRARAALTPGRGIFAHPDALALVERRGLEVVREPLERWIGEGRGSPSAASLDEAERLARSGDPALIRPRAAEAHLVVLVDEARAASALGVVSGERRALVLPGDRVEQRSPVHSPAAVEAAVVRGARTLLAERSP